MGSETQNEDLALACPDCGSKLSRVTHSYPVGYRNRTYIRRRRECQRCAYTYYTKEILEEDTQALKTPIPETDFTTHENSNSETLKNKPNLTNPYI